MGKLDLELILLMPVAIMADYWYLAWPPIVLTVVWLFHRHFTRSDDDAEFALAMWRVLVGIAAWGIVTFTALIVFPSQGDQGAGRVIVGIFALPLIVPVALCFFIRPRSHKGGK